MKTNDNFLFVKEKENYPFLIVLGLEIGLLYDIILFSINREAEA